MSKLITVTNLRQFKNEYTSSIIDPLTERVNDAEVGISEILDGKATVKKATQDGNGNVIASTYAKKSELQAISSSVSTVFRFKGQRASFNDLPDPASCAIGDVYMVNDSEYVCIFDENANTNAFALLGRYQDTATDTDIHELFMQ